MKEGKPVCLWVGALERESKGGHKKSLQMGSKMGSIIFHAQGWHPSVSQFCSNSPVPWFIDICIRDLLLKVSSKCIEKRLSPSVFPPLLKVCVCMCVCAHVAYTMICRLGVIYIKVRLVFVAQQWGVTEPEKEKQSLKKQHPAAQNNSERLLPSVATEQLFSVCSNLMNQSK